MNQRVIGIGERKGRAKVNTIRTTTSLVIAIFTAVLSADAQEFRSRHVHKAEDPAKFRVGEVAEYSGPQPGEKLRGFTVIPPRRNHLEEFDPVALGLGKPHLLIFIDDSDIGEGIGPFINAAWMVDKQSQTGLAASVVLLAHERTTKPEFNTMEDGSWNLFNSVYRIGYSPDGRDGPGAYGLNRDILMTILIADAEGKVLYNFPYRQRLSDYPSTHVLGGLAAAVGEDRETVASWLNNIRASITNFL